MARTLFWNLFQNLDGLRRYAANYVLHYLIHCILVMVDTQIKSPGPEVIKLFSCSAQLSMKVFLLINVKMPTIVGILTFMSRKNSILGVSESKKARFLIFLYL